MSDCTHLDDMQVDPAAVNRGPGLVCQACVDKGDTWVNLRKCMTCGEVGCCDSSINKHATAHYNETGHPLILNMSDGGPWIWCYEDQEVVAE